MSRPGSSASGPAPPCTSSTPHWLPLGLAMPNLGDIDRQTDRGRHSARAPTAPGARFGGLADAVRGVQHRHSPTDRVHDCDAGNEPDLFEAARIGLGALGIITELTLQCVPAFVLQAGEDPGTLSGTLADLDALVDGTDHFEFYWFPHTDRVAHQAQHAAAGGRRRASAARVAGVARRRPAVEPRLRGASTGSAPRDRGRCPRINRVTSRVAVARASSPTASHRVFTSAARRAVPGDGVRRAAGPRLPASSSRSRSSPIERGLAHAVPRRGALRRGRRRLAVDGARPGVGLHRGAPVPPHGAPGVLRRRSRPMAREAMAGARTGASCTDARAPTWRRPTRASTTSSRCATASTPTGCSRTTYLARVLGA